MLHAAVNFEKGGKFRYCYKLKYLHEKKADKMHNYEFSKSFLTQDYCVQLLQ